MDYGNISAVSSENALGMVAASLRRGDHKIDDVLSASNQQESRDQFCMIGQEKSGRYSKKTCFFLHDGRSHR